MKYDQLESNIQTKWAGKNIYFFEETDSTNVQAKRLAEAGAEHGTLVIAKKQTAGRGRHGRVWESPDEKNVNFTLISRPSINPNKAPMLTLVMALSVAKAIEEVAKMKVGIKWPNDIVLNGKKVVGILTEMSAKPDLICYVVIGVGINVDRQAFSEELSKKATSLEAETKQEIAHAALIQKSMEYFEKDYATFLRKRDMSELLEDYNRWLVNKDREVRVLDPQGEFSGVARGINPEGELLVEMVDGHMATVYAGEVSVRGIFGYV